MKKIILLIVALALMGAELPYLPTPKERERIWRKADGFRFSFDFLMKDSIRSQKIHEFTSPDLTEDNFAKYPCVGIGGCVHVFRNKAGDQTIVIQTITDEAPVEEYLFFTRRVPNDLAPFGHLSQEDQEEMCADHYRCITLTDPKQFLQKKIKFARKVDNKYFVTEKGVKLGMTYKDVIKIYGKPDRKEINQSDRSKIKCIWTIQGFWHDKYEEVPLEGTQLEDARRTGEKIWVYYQKTVEFDNLRVAQIHFETPTP